MRVTSLSKCCEIVSGATPRRGVDEYWKNEINWFTPKDLSKLKSRYVGDSPEKISLAGLQSCSAKLLPAGTLLFSSRAPIGHLAITTNECCTNQGFKSLVPSEDVDVLYLYYFMLSAKPRLQDLGTGATFKELNKKTLSTFQIPLPSLPEQRAIASRLDAADRLRQLDKALVEKYDELKRSLFLEMFGDWTSEITYPEENLEDLALKVVDCPHSTPPYESEITEYPCIRTTDIKNGEIAWSKMKYLSSENHALRNKRLEPMVGDVIYSREGTYGDCVVVAEGLNLSLGQRVMLIRPDTQKVLSCYLHGAIRSDYVYRQGQKKNMGSTVGHVNMKDIRKFRIPVPPIKDQREYKNLFSSVNYQQSLARVGLGCSEEIFQGLLGEVFG